MDALDGFVGRQTTTDGSDRTTRGWLRRSTEARTCVCVRVRVSVRWFVWDTW